ncbi:MAG: hypothetical protein ACI8UR_000909 [Natronomonas sp.]|jgi:hypothetical protein|uniref:hypothetical protein n=1 Tax=Natronomonas sp. TaxID=2184060 RepID=UPI003989CC93
MSMRTAARQNKVVLAGLLLFAGWVALTALNVFNSTTASSLGSWVGQHPTGGVVGILALLFILALTVGVYGELAESDPAPEEWPPE